MWKFIVGSAFGFILSLYINSGYFYSTEKNPVKQSEKKILLHPTNIRTEQKYPLASENIVSEFSSTKKNIKELPPETTPPASYNSSTNERLKIEQNRLNFMNQKRAAAENYFRVGDANKIAELASNTFENEAVDIDWSSEQQKNIEDLIRNSKETYDIAPTSIECRSSRCKITISGSNTEQAMHAFQSIQAATKNGEAGLPNEVMFTNNAKSAAFEFYVPRDESVNMYQ